VLKFYENKYIQLKLCSNSSDLWNWVNQRYFNFINGVRRLQQEWNFLQKNVYCQNLYIHKIIFHVILIIGFAYRLGKQKCTSNRKSSVSIGRFWFIEKALF
jgi:hypothetical protein